MNAYKFDETLYKGDSARDFYFFCIKRNKSLFKFLPRQGAAFLKYALNRISKTQFTEEVYVFLTGIKDIDAEVKLFWETHEKNIKKWPADWRLADDVIISASPEFLLVPIAKKFKFALIATKVDKHTGKIAGEVCRGEEKVKRFRELYGTTPIIRFFTDSLTDAPLAGKADRAYMIKGERVIFWDEYIGKNKKPCKKECKAYDKICSLEEDCFYRKFLPYSAGSPETFPTYSNRLTDQLGRVNIVYFADSHTDGIYSHIHLDNVKRTVEFANNAPIEYDAVINAGDMITPFGKTPKEKAYKMADNFFRLAKKSRVPFIFTKGNHDLNDWDNYPNRVLTDKDWGQLFYNFAEETYGIVRQTKKSGEKSTWHYYDIEDKKIRIVAVDIQDSDKNMLNEKGVCRLHGGNSYYISNEQMNWIADTAFNFDDKCEKDWGIIITLHQYPKELKYHENAADVLLDLCVALNEQGTYSHKYQHKENSFFDMDVNADFTRYANEEGKPHMICWLLGHIHERKNEVRKGINMIYTINGSCDTTSSDPRVVRISGTCTQNSFDVVNIDTLHRKIRIFAYGAGTTCYGECGDRFLPDGLSY